MRGLTYFHEKRDRRRSFEGFSEILSSCEISCCIVMQLGASRVFAQEEMYTAKTFAHTFAITYCYNFSSWRTVESAKGRIVWNARVNSHDDSREARSVLQSIFFLIYKVQISESTD